MQSLKSQDFTTEKKTLIEEGTELTGSIASNCPVMVKGKVEGDVTAPSLRISATGAVHGHVKVGVMVSEGEISGEFDADSIQLSGVVKNQTIVRAKSLEVKLTPVNGKIETVFGECMLEVGEPPTKEAAVTAAMTADRTEPTTPARTSSETGKSASVVPGNAGTDKQKASSGPSRPQPAVESAITEALESSGAPAPNPDPAAIIEALSDPSPGVDAEGDLSRRKSSGPRRP